MLLAFKKVEKKGRENLNIHTSLIHARQKVKQSGKPTMMEDLFCKLLVALFVLLAVVALIN